MMRMIAILVIGIPTIAHRDRRQRWVLDVTQSAETVTEQIDNSSNNAKSSLMLLKRTAYYEAAIYASLCGDVDRMMLAAAAESTSLGLA